MGRGLFGVVPRGMFDVRHEMRDVECEMRDVGRGVTAGEPPLSTGAPLSVDCRHSSVKCGFLVAGLGSMSPVHSLDPAILRPGRIDRVIYIGLPEKSERRAILDIALQNTPTAVDDAELEELAEALEGYTGAEIVSLCREAMYGALQEDLHTDRVGMRHLRGAMAAVRPRVSPTDVAFYQLWLQRFHAKV